VRAEHLGAIVVARKAAGRKALTTMAFSEDAKRRTSRYTMQNHGEQEHD
jgi:hypothetical protein